MGRLHKNCLSGTCTGAAYPRACHSVSVVRVCQKAGLRNQPFQYNPALFSPEASLVRMYDVYSIK